MELYQKYVRIPAGLGVEVIIQVIPSTHQRLFPSQKNASAFHLKRLYVLGKMHLRLKENVLAFCDERKDVFLCLFWGLEKPCFQTSSAPMMSRTELYP